MGELARMAAEPSEHQRSLWWDYIAFKDEPVLLVSGMFVWMGWCPLCDTTKSNEHVTARFDFRRSLLYCENGKDGKSCHGQRSISLNNAVMRMGSGTR